MIGITADDTLTWALLIGAILSVLGIIARIIYRVWMVVKRQLMLMEYVSKEMHFNGGSSMRDAQWRQEQMIRIVIAHIGIKLPEHLDRPKLPPPQQEDRIRYGS